VEDPRRRLPALPSAGLGASRRFRVSRLQGRDGPRRSQRAGRCADRELPPIFERP
jgi:hypothetical protein